MSGRAWRLLTVGAALAFLALFFLYPVAAIVERGLRGAGDAPPDVLTDPLTREIVWFAVVPGESSTVLHDRRGVRRPASAATGSGAGVW